MKITTKIAACVAFTASILIGKAVELEGSFYIDRESMDCRIKNLSKVSIVIEGLKDEMLRARFFDKNNVEIPAENEYTPDSKLFQDWTRLLSASPDGVNPGSIYRLIMHFSNLPRNQRDNIEYIVFEAKLYPLSSDKRLLDGKRVKIRLKHKNA